MLLILSACVAHQAWAHWHINLCCQLLLLTFFRLPLMSTFALHICGVLFCNDDWQRAPGFQPKFSAGDTSVSGKLRDNCLSLSSLLETIPHPVHSLEGHSVQSISLCMNLMFLLHVALGRRHPLALALNSIPWCLAPDVLDQHTIGNKIMAVRQTCSGRIIYNCSCESGSARDLIRIAVAKWTSQGI